MKKKLFVCFALAAGLMMGAIPGMQVSASGENVIAAEKVTDLDEYTFVADRSVEAFSIHGEARLADHWRQMQKRQPFYLLDCCDEWQFCLYYGTISWK